MNLITIPYTTVKMALGARPAPEGWDIIGTHAVRTSDTWNSGVLVRNKSTGIYSLLSCGALTSVDQRAAREYAEKEA